VHVNIDILKDVLLQSWSRNTSYPKAKGKWNQNNPALGQCAVTSLVVQDIFGGRIIYNKDFHHYWNILRDGTVLDLTKDQFGDDLKIDRYEVSSRNHLLKSSAAIRAKTPERYAMLKQRVAQLLLIKPEE